jgi:hypothetical protein
VSIHGSSITRIDIDQSGRRDSVDQLGIQEFTYRVRKQNKLRGISQSKQSFATSFKFNQPLTFILR